VIAGIRHMPAGFGVEGADVAPRVMEHVQQLVD